MAKIGPWWFRWKAYSERKGVGEKETTWKIALFADVDEIEEPDAVELELGRIPTQSLLQSAARFSPCQAANEERDPRLKGYEKKRRFQVVRFNLNRKKSKNSFLARGEFSSS